MLGGVPVAREEGRGGEWEEHGEERLIPHDDSGAGAKDGAAEAEELARGLGGCIEGEGRGGEEGEGGGTSTPTP